MKTITYTPETHVLVPRAPTRFMVALGWDSAVEHGADNIDINDTAAIYRAMIAAAPQPEPVESEPAMWVMKHIRSGDLAQAKPNQKALHPYMWSDVFPRYTTPQPDRGAELEAALKVARDGTDKFLVANDPTEFGCACDLSVGYLCGPCHADKQQQPLKSALAKINEVLNILHDANAWETVSGEPQNFQEDEANTATVEDGSVAKAAISRVKGEQ